MLREKRNAPSASDGSGSGRLPDSVEEEGLEVVDALDRLLERDALDGRVDTDVLGGDANGARGTCGVVRTRGAANVEVACVGRVEVAESSSCVCKSIVCH
jgi:hypothetical protein